MRVRGQRAVHANRAEETQPDEPEPEAAECEYPDHNREDTDRESRAKGTVADGRKWLREQGCDEEGVVAVEKIMQDANLANYEIAFSHFARNQPKPETLPSGAYGGQSLDWFQAAEDAPDHKLLLEAPEKFKNAEVRKFFQQRAEGRLNLAP